MGEKGSGGEKDLCDGFLLEIVKAYILRHFGEGKERAVEDAAFAGGKAVLEYHLYPLAAAGVLPEPVAEIGAQPALTFQRRHGFLLVEHPHRLALRIGLGVEDLHLTAVEQLFHKLQGTYAARAVIKGAGGVAETAL